jgi:hypothetical protein
MPTLLLLLYIAFESFGQHIILACTPIRTIMVCVSYKRSVYLLYTFFTSTIDLGESCYEYNEYKNSFCLDLSISILYSSSWLMKYVMILYI